MDGLRSSTEIGCLLRRKEISFRLHILCLCGTLYLMRLCGKCGGPNTRKRLLKNTKRKFPSYCMGCHNGYMREWRKTHPLTEMQKKRDTARSYAHEYLKRGHIKRDSCKVCGKKAQMHHPDYDKPTEVEWLCRKHHLALHLNEMASS